MKALWMIVFVFGTVAFSSAKAQHAPVAIGVRISSSAPVINSSVSARFYMNNKQAIETLLSFDPLALGVMYEAFRTLGAEGLNWFYGGGVYTSFKKPVNAGLQGVVGLDYNFAGVPLNLSIDWKPELSLTRTVNFEPAAVGVSARFVIR